MVKINNKFGHRTNSICVIVISRRKMQFINQLRLTLWLVEDCVENWKKSVRDVVWNRFSNIRSFIFDCHRFFFCALVAQVDRNRFLVRVVKIETKIFAENKYGFRVCRFASLFGSLANRLRNIYFLSPLWATYILPIKYAIFDWAHSAQCYSK